MRFPLWLAFFSALSVFSFGQDMKRPIYDSELVSILDECQSLRGQLQNSLDNLRKADETQLELQATLNEKQARIDDLLDRSKSLADSLESSENLSRMLAEQLAGLRTSFEQYRSAVAWEQTKTAALWAAGWVVVGLIIGLLF